MTGIAVRACNFCQCHDARLVFHGYGFYRPQDRYDLYECTRCGLVRLEPLLTPAELVPFYRPEYYGSNEAKFIGPLEVLMGRTHIRRARRLARLVPESAQGRRRVLDIGCGRGLFLRAMRDRGFEAIGTELPGFDFPTVPDVQFLHAAAENLPFGEAEFDIVSIWHVLEHTTDPATVLRTIGRILRPGGLLVLAVPNFGSWQARHFGRHWFHLDLPRHLYHFRLESLARMLKQQRLEISEVRTQSWDQNPYGFVQSWLNRIYWRSTPNGLYQVLKHGQVRRREGLGRMLGYFLLGSLALPAALVENLISVARGQGATLVLHGRKMC